MAESKMKEVAKLLGVEMGVPFNIKNESGQLISNKPFILKKDGIYNKYNSLCSFALTSLLNGKYEIEPPILDKIEKRYLEGMLRPFKDRVKYIQKHGSHVVNKEHKEYINIVMSSTTSYLCYENMPMPYFDKGEIYIGMELNKEYTLEELGLFQNKESEK